MAATFTPNREELAWAAGFFDGEGHVSSRLKRSGAGNLSRGIQLIIGQRHIEPLERYRIAVGGIGKVYTGSKDNRPFYQYSLARQETVQAAIVMMWPFLCSVKRAQAIGALTKFQDLKGVN